MQHPWFEMQEIVHQILTGVQEGDEVFRLGFAARCGLKSKYCRTNADELSRQEDTDMPALGKC